MSFFYSCRNTTVRPGLDKPASWACYYGKDPEVLRNLNECHIAVVEPDISGFFPPVNSGTLFAGYVSIGEAEKFRWYWPLIENSDFIGPENENWENDFFVDIRSRKWRELLIRRIIPKILSKGYKALFFDTIDSPLFLEEKYPLKYKGCEDSLASFIAEVKETFPEIILISNNGMRAVKKIGKFFDVYCLEGLNTAYDFDTGTYNKTDENWRKKRIGFIKNNPEITSGKPVLVLDYMENKESRLREYSLIECRKHGFLPFHSEISLKEYFGCEKMPL